MLVLILNLFTSVKFKFVMFSDSRIEITGFDSCPESEKLVNDNSSQTADLLTSTQATQTVGSTSFAVQAAPDGTPPSHSYDANKLLNFLKKVMPHLEEELGTFDNLDITKDVDEEQESSEQAHKQIIIQPDFTKDRVISSLSWNSTKIMLAVGCSKKAHEGWCCHETSVGLYNTGKAHFEKQPEQTLKVSGCVKCLEFHGRIPSLLACGLYSGEVIIWDLKHDEEVFVTNKKGTGDEPAHVDAITTVTWRENESGLWLVTAGRDGRIVLWKVNLASLIFEVHERYIILKQHLTPGAQITEHLDVLQIDFLPTKGPNFVTAASGGVVFYCSLTAARFLTALPHKDPVIKSYKPRNGIVTSVSCGPDMFASGGTDFEIHIFKYDQESPVLRIHASYAVLGIWWTAPESLIYWGDSKVDRYFINSGKMVSICEVEGISSATFKTGSMKERLAIGDKTGAVRIVTHWEN